MVNAFLHPVPPKPRFRLGKIRAGAVACLCLWATADLSAAPTPVPDSAAAGAVYRQAMDSFNKENYSHALDLLERVPDTGKAGEQADVLNLRGAVYLHQRRYDKARVAFTKAIEKDSGLWAARFNLAEVNFRQGKYAESSKQFEELLGRTSRWTRSDERGFLQYKLLLTQMLAGKEKPTQTYIEEHRGDRVAPLMYYYLNAAVEHRRGHDRQAEQWLAQGDAHYSPANEQVFAESFRSLGWYTQRSERLIAAARRRDASSTTPTSLAVVELIPGQTPAPRPADAPAKNSAALALPPAPKPAFRTTAAPAPAGEMDATQTPPAAERNDLPDNNLPVADDADAVQDNPDPRAVYSRPVVLGRPTNSGSKPKPTPGASSPSATASATPGASASAAPTSTPAATTAAAPKPEFLEKYEQAYVKFLEKSYSDARKLLDEADALQPGQTTSANLRGQIFKHYYETAYMAYKQRGDYNEALAQLSEADTTQPNQPDALNLRGLTYSKQKDYERAEGAFKRAIQADPQFWAARFNYAELPFNYRNYTAARTRFEELSAQTDASKQPREAELTQFKIFLTLLLEGKVDGARSFMNHLSFTGTTPARYFCQAALEFYAGNSDKAQDEIKNANKEFQPRLVDIFKESFYRIGWLADPSNPSASPTIAAVTPAASPAEMVPAASPASSPVIVAMASATPALVEATPAATVNSANPTPAPSLAVAAATPLPTAAPVESVGPTVAQTSTSEPAATPADARPAKLSKRDNMIRLGLIGVVVLTFIFNCIQLLIAVMNHKPRRPVPVKRSPLYADRPETEQPDEVEIPR